MASKLAGSVLEKEQMGHTHVTGCLLAFSGTGDAVLTPLLCGNGDLEGLRGGELALEPVSY